MPHSTRTQAMLPLWDSPLDLRTTLSLNEHTKVHRGQPRRIIVRRKEDLAKMTHAGMALVERGLGAKQAHAKSRSARALMAMVRVMLVRV